MAEWSSTCATLPREQAPDEQAPHELSANELSWVLTLSLDAPADEPPAFPACAASPASSASPVSSASPASPSHARLRRKLSNRLSANTARARRKVYVEELEARVPALEQQNAWLRAQLRDAQRENMRLQGAARSQHMLRID